MARNIIKTHSDTHIHTKDRWAVCLPQCREKIQEVILFRDVINVKTNMS